MPTGSSSAYYALLMKKRIEPRRGQRGYSLVELLIVLAMIGMFTLVTVPPVISYMGQIRVRSATRVLNGELRAARQRAITKNNPVAFSFTVGDVDPSSAGEKAQFSIYDRGGTSGAYTWTQVGQTKYLEGVYFLASPFPVASAVNDSQPDIIFRPNGTIDNMTGVTPPAVVAFRTERNVTNNHVTDTFSVSGSFTTTLTTD